MITKYNRFLYERKDIELAEDRLKLAKDIVAAFIQHVKEKISYYLDGEPEQEKADKITLLKPNLKYEDLDDIKDNINIFVYNTGDIKLLVQWGASESGTIENTSNLASYGWNDDNTVRILTINMENVLKNISIL